MSHSGAAEAVVVQTAIELALGIGAALLLARDVQRARRDPLRRPITLLVAGVMAALLIGVIGGRAHPNPWWLLIPAGILAWEVARGWRRAPRCHLWEGGVGAFAASLLLAAVGLGSGAGKVATVLLAAAAAAGLGGGVLFWLSQRREPPPSRVGDGTHFERRSTRRQA